MSTTGPAALPQPVLVRGTGLLGTSIGLALRGRGVEVLLHDPSPSALAVARDIGAGRAVDLDAGGDAAGARDAAEVPAPRTDLTPVSITQPEGTSFTVDGHEVRWQKWRFRIGFTPREGVVLHTVRYTDGDRERSVLYRASLSV